MATFQTRPMPVEAVQWDGTNDSEVQTLALHANVDRYGFDDELLPMLRVVTSTRNLRMSIGDWVLKYPAGWLQVVDSDTFTEQYEPQGEPVGP